MKQQHGRRMEEADQQEAATFLLFEPPFFEKIVVFLDVPSAMRLRQSCQNARNACSSTELRSWRHGTVLSAMLQTRGPPPGRPANFWFQAPVVTDVHLAWLFENSEQLVKVDLRDAPFPTDVLLRKIASDCPNLQQFSVERGADALRTSFVRGELTGLTAAGVVALVEHCSQLQHLCLSWCEAVNGDTVCEALSQRSPALHSTLQYLNLDGVRTTDRAIRSLANCTNLRTLKIKDTSAVDISPLASCTRLETLHLCRGWRVAAETVVAACEGGFGRSIRVLCCGGCRNIDDATARAVVKICPKLEIWNCVRGTAVSSGFRYSFDKELKAADRNICLDDTGIC